MAGTATDEQVELIRRDRSNSFRRLALLRGYANHPDYAELGRAEASITLLEAVGARQVDLANVGDLLTW